MLEKFVEKSPGCWVAFSKSTKPFFAVRAVREPKGWRIDKCAAVAGAWMPWEPVDEKFYPSAEAAKRALKRKA